MPNMSIPNMSLRMRFVVAVDHDGDSFHAFCPGLKGLHVDGVTEEEALQNAVEAAQLYVESMISNNEPLPIGEDFHAEADSIHPAPKLKTLSRDVEMPWSSLQACGVS